jgi:hypothetical protein
MIWEAESYKKPRDNFSHQVAYNKSQQSQTDMVKAYITKTNVSQLQATYKISLPLIISLKSEHR